MGIGDITDFYTAVRNTFRAQHLFELIICSMAYHCLSFACQDCLLDLPLGVSFEVLMNSLHQSKRFLVLMHINVWHPVTKACVSLKHDYFALWSNKNPLLQCVIRDTEAIFFKLGDRK